MNAISLRLMHPRFELDDYFALFIDGRGPLSGDIPSARDKAQYDKKEKDVPQTASLERKIASHGN